MSVDVVDIFVSAFIHEPVVENDSEAIDFYKYIHGDKGFYIKK